MDSLDINTSWEKSTIIISEVKEYKSDVKKLNTKRLHPMGPRPRYSYKVVHKTYRKGKVIP